MDIRIRRALLPAALAAILLLFLGWHAVPAHADSVDPELVAESVSEDGYYVDSGASYLKSDSDLDKLRERVEKAGHACVIVLPAGTAAQPVISQLLGEPNRRATYVVLTGSQLQAVSNNISRSKLNGLVAKARKAGNPPAEVLALLDMLGGKPQAPAGTKAKTHKAPSTAASASDETAAPSTSPVAAAKKDSGNGLLYAVVGVVVVLILAAVGFILWRRKQGSSGGPGPDMPMMT